MAARGMWRWLLGARTGSSPRSIWSDSVLIRSITASVSSGAAPVISRMGCEMRCTITSGLSSVFTELRPLLMVMVWLIVGKRASSCTARAQRAL